MNIATAKSQSIANKEPMAMINKSGNKGSNKNALPDVVTQAFEDYPASVRKVLLDVRKLVFKIQEKDTEIGELNETLRWGELTYLTEKPKTGSMIRLAMTRSGEPAVFFHCGTSLIDQFRTQYAHVFEFEKNRALVLTGPVSDIKAELSDCLTQALRYKLDKG